MDSDQSLKSARCLAIIDSHLELGLQLVSGEPIIVTATISAMAENKSASAKDDTRVIGVSSFLNARSFEFVKNRLR